ncbi:binding-protein-dependent transport systems inner membrane component [Candidatus Vecturithrix granuli]|uniref:Binding-protein-dependent transport systems inner membrane component n=1 Tax=Vecturithrix granuli TaxID=1499967 RepID=A0A081BUU2_VECG1|nr:binding-protein-dependent transport systems inner membrane component [Candidatus Vecturithrix granuli]
MSIMNTNSDTINLRSHDAYRRDVWKTLQYVVLIAVSVLFLIPLFWLILSSLKTQTEMVTFPPKFLPEIPQFQNYLLAVTKIDYLRYLLNTVELGLIYTVPGIMSAALFGYAFARFHAPGKNFLFNIVLVLIMIPPVAVMIPEYAFFARLRLINTYYIWLLWGIGGNPLYIYLFKQFFSYFPKELEDAALLDGCSQLDILFRIFLPLSKPIIVTVFLLSFLFVYGDFMGPVIFLSGNNTTLAVAMANGYVIRNGILLVPVLLAGIVIYLIPIILIFTFGQKYYIQGLLSSSGVKG